MRFLKLWVTSYFSPARAVAALKDKPAPQWGLYGVLIRCLLVSLCWYLPAHLLGRVPSSPPPSLRALPAEDYYLAMVFIFPLFTLAIWLLDGALAHVLLRLIGRESSIYQILNIDGMGNLIIGLPIVAWDWFALALGWDSATVIWGLMHLLIDLWYIVFVIMGLKRILRLPLWLAATIIVLWYAYSVPLSMPFIIP